VNTLRNLPGHCCIVLWRHLTTHALHLACTVTVGIGAAALTPAPAHLAAQAVTKLAASGHQQATTAVLHNPFQDPVITSSVMDPNQDVIPDPDLCGENGYRIAGTDLCTHGLDVEPDDDEVAHAEMGLDDVSLPISTYCVGDGTSGKRVQVMYVRPSDRSDRYAASLSMIRTMATNVNQLFSASARATGGTRLVNYVMTPDCEIDVLNVEIGTSDDDTLAATTRALAALGYNSPERKYLLFMEAEVYCGIGTVIGDNQPGPENKSNLRTGYARVDRSCWNVVTAAHELTHTLGGVQHTAPHASGGWHCIDENDIMCYSDPPYYPTLTVLCDEASYAELLDCNHDDYFHTNPPGDSYLATHWNVANSQFLLNLDQYESDVSVRLSVTPITSTQTTTSEFLLKVNYTGTGIEQIVAATDRVEFYQDDQLLATTTDGPFEVAWVAPEPGVYVIEAKIYGVDGSRYFQELRVKVAEKVPVLTMLYLPVIQRD
jgi:hypothetical protein